MKPLSVPPPSRRRINAIRWTRQCWRTQHGHDSWIGSKPRKEDAAIAKNYLNAEELDTLNRIVNGYLEFAELQARNRKPMTMQNWIAKLDDFLRLGERDVLTHAGHVSHQEALETAEREYEKYRKQQLEQASRVEVDFEQAIKRLPSGKAGKKK